MVIVRSCPRSQRAVHGLKLSMQSRRGMHEPSSLSACGLKLSADSAVQPRCGGEILARDVLSGGGPGCGGLPSGLPTSGLPLLTARTTASTTTATKRTPMSGAAALVLMRIPQSRTVPPTARADRHQSSEPRLTLNSGGCVDGSFGSACSAVNVAIAPGEAGTICILDPQALSLCWKGITRSRCHCLPATVLSVDDVHRCGARRTGTQRSCALISMRPAAQHVR